MLRDFATCLSFLFTMLGDDEDVFDSVTWESPAAPTYETTPSGPGFRQDTAEGSEPGPHEPKWEGYLITSVQDPMKELAETKDAYDEARALEALWRELEKEQREVYQVPFTPHASAPLNRY